MSPLKIMEDNQGAIAIAKNPVAHAHTKHIDIRFHYVREAIEEGIIEIEYCPTDVNLVAYGEHSCSVLVSPPGLSIYVPVSKKP